jgi:hypothetical protein
MIVLALGAVVGMGVPLAARAQSCPAAKAEPEVRLAVELPPPSYDHSLSRAQIGVLSGHGHVAPNQRHAGLTRTQTDFTVKPTVEFHRLPGGQMCAMVKRLDATWRMTQLRVDIAAEYGTGSCAYGEVIRHENQHVAVAQRAFATAERALRADLRDLARRTPPFVIRATPDATAQQIASRFLAAGRPALDRYKRDSDRENAVLDSPESYRAVSARCRDW